MFLKSCIPYSSHRRSVAGISVKLEAKPVNRVSFHVEGRSNIASGWLQSINPLHAGSTWPWAKNENARKPSISHQPSMPRGTKRENFFVLGIIYPKFPWACSGHTHYFQWHLFPAVTESTIPSPPNYIGHASSLCPAPFPSVFQRTCL